MRTACMGVSKIVFVACVQDAYGMRTGCVQDAQKFTAFRLNYKDSCEMRGRFIWDVCGLRVGCVQDAWDMRVICVRVSKSLQFICVGVAKTLQ